jgi:hypothetical protein
MLCKAETELVSANQALVNELSNAQTDLDQNSLPSKLFTANIALSKAISNAQAAEQK